MYSKRHLKMKNLYEVYTIFIFIFFQMEKMFLSQVMGNQTFNGDGLSNDCNIMEESVTL